jgi:hypothetical protein
MLVGYDFEAFGKLKIFLKNKRKIIIHYSGVLITLRAKLYITTVKKYIQSANLVSFELGIFIHRLRNTALQYAIDSSSK